MIDYEDSDLYMSEEERQFGEDSAIMTFEATYVPPRYKPRFGPPHPCRVNLCEHNHRTLDESDPF